MTNAYPMLTYRGRVEIEPTAIAGFDEVGRYYEVLEVEFHNPEPDIPDYVCNRDDPHTHLYLQYATPETLRRERERLANFVAAVQEMEGRLPS